MSNKKKSWLDDNEPPCHTEKKKKGKESTILKVKEKNKIAKDAINKQKKIDNLLKMLNYPTTGYMFWDETSHGDIIGIQPISRLVIRKINENGFNPFIKESVEKFTRFYVIDIVGSNDKYNYNENDKNKKLELEDFGVIYIKSENINFIYEFIRKNT